MPELPEVETVRRGLEPYLESATIRDVTLFRPDLRFAFPAQFAPRLMGRRIETLGRRAKYLVFTLSDGAVWLSHLGMTGAFFIDDVSLDGPSRLNRADESGRHIHFSARLAHPVHGQLTLNYADPRRFGFMDLYEKEAPNRFLDGLGPEPLGNQLSSDFLGAAFAARKGPVKTVLLDQRVIAGLGNIYVCEALHRAGISPLRSAASLVDGKGRPDPALERLATAIRVVLEDALEAGGSTLRDFRNAEGQPGYFQHRFAVYGREGAPCLADGCGGVVERAVQAGRSSFFCPVCQH